MATVFELPELRALQSGRGLIRIPTEQDVPFTRRVQALVDAPEFRRMGQISQLGLVSRVYPGAVHTRFEHALGVFHNALKYLQQLAHDPRCRELIDVRSAELLMAASLLHDLGHWPFCHPIEDLGLAEAARGAPSAAAERILRHEQFAAEFLGPSSELAQVLAAEWNIRAEELLPLLLRDAEDRDCRRRLLRSILSGPIDVDKLDYVERDSLHAGVPYGRNFDKPRLIQSLLLNEAGDGLAISSKGRTAAELVVFARYVMFSEVYWHHAVRSATAMFGRAFLELAPQLDLRSLYRCSEAEMIARLREAARGTVAEGLLDGLFGARRTLYKRVVEFSFHEEPELHALLKGRSARLLAECGRRLGARLAAETGEPVGPADLLIDAPPAHREVEFRVQVYFAKDRRWRWLHEISPVVTALAQRQFDELVKRVRLFAHPRIRDVAARCPRLELMLRDSLAEAEAASL
jgi:HD superfamily phosphohydrolase